MDDDDRDVVVFEKCDVGAAAAAVVEAWRRNLVRQLLWIGHELGEERAYLGDCVG